VSESTPDQYYRTDRFEVGDEVWWHIPTVMDFCRSWAPDITKPTTVIAVKDHPCGASDHPNRARHSQLVRVSPNYCPYGDEFEGSWLLPVGVKSHNDAAFRAHLAKE
jgi:hypothetical protein